MNYDNSGVVLADARNLALVAATYTDDTPRDPDSDARESIRQLEHVAPAAGTAAALLGTASVRPVPIDPHTLQATGEPMASLTAVVRHYQARPFDGAAVRAGVQANGGALFGVHGTLAEVRGWMAAVGTEVNERVDEYGNVVHSRSYRAGTPYIAVTWAAPSGMVARSVVVSGAGLLDAARQLPGDAANNRRSLQGETYLVWPVAASEGQQLVVRSRKLAHGVSVVGEGDLVPWHVRRADGQTLSAARVPIPDAEPLSPWLVTAVGARTKAVTR